MNPHSSIIPNSQKCVCACVHLVAPSFPTLWDPMDCSPPGSSVLGILQARILEWVAMPSSRGSSQPRDLTQLSCIAGGFFTNWATREVHEYLSGQPIPSPGDLGWATREAKRWGQPKCLSMEKRVRKIWSLHTMEYYWAIKGMKYWYMWVATQWHC